MLYTMIGGVSSFMHMVLIGEQSKPSLEQVEDFELLCVYVCIHCNITCKDDEGVTVLFIIFW